MELAGAVTVEYIGRSKIVWRPGRHDAKSASEGTSDGRLPDADKGQVGATTHHLRAIIN